MENSCMDVVPHPQFMELLFAFKSKVSSVFSDVLGIHEIDHIAITRINRINELITLSSTPAMEFNLFNGPLWRHDQTYNQKWFKLGTQAYWPTLYNKARYDELYYLKQIKHSFPLGLSLAGKIGDDHFIFSLASHKNCPHTRELFSTLQEDFYKIGLYCTNMLNPLFSHCDALGSQALPLQVNYETSK